ncbi:MAG: hypothetical protein QXG54_06140 [Desulfurococcaceae archaeon]
MFLSRKKSKEQDEVELKRLFYKEIVYLLVRAFYVSTLKWYELLVVVICGVFLGIGVGLLIAVYVYPPTPKTIVIPLNETHIIRVG